MIVNRLSLIHFSFFYQSRVDKSQFPALRTRLVENRVSLSRVIHRQVLQTIVQFFVHYESQISGKEFRFCGLPSIKYSHETQKKRRKLETDKILFVKQQQQLRLQDDEKVVYKRYEYASKGIDRYPEPTIEQLLEPDQIDHKLLDQDRLSISSDDPVPNPTLVTSTPPDDHLERCPACSQSVCFDSLRFAICRVGHVWGTFILLSLPLSHI